MKPAEYITNNYQQFFDYIKLKSISAQNTGIEETSDWIVNQFKNLGAEISEKWNDQGGNPVVFASFKGNSEKTVLFYNHYDVQPPDPLDKTTQKIINNTKFNVERASKNVGLKKDIITNQPEESLINGTTVTINGISGGYEGDGIKTIVPKQASAKLDCRLVPNQDPEKIFKLIQNHLKNHGFEDIKATYNIGEKPFRTDLNDPFVKLNIDTAKEIYGEKFKVVPNMPGSGPAYAFYNTLNNPIVMVGVHYAGSGPHAPNENIREQDFIDATLYMIQLIKNYEQNNTMEK